MPTPEDLNDARNALYENEALREDLDDDSAERLLAWGAQQLEVLAQRLPEGDEDGWENAQKSLRTALKALDKLAGARANLDEESLSAYEARLAQCAPSLGVTLSAEQIHAALPSAVDDVPSALNNLLSLLGAGQASTPASEVPTPEPTPESAPSAPHAEADAPPETPAAEPSAQEAQQAAQQAVNEVIGKLRGLFGG